jgi:hypothetical protein
LLSPEMLAILFGYSYVITDLIVEKARFLEKYRNILGLRIVFFHIWDLIFTFRIQLSLLATLDLKLNNFVSCLYSYLVFV